MNDASIYQNNTVKVWDISIRLMHWSLVAGIGFLWFSGEEGGTIMKWHIYTGYYMLGLVTYRFLWGFMGSRYARFSNFLYSPKNTFTYAQKLLNKQSKAYIGHNPLGGWMVLTLLLLVLIQAISGLFTSDDIFTEGPLYILVSSKTGDLLTSIHHLNFNFLLAAIALHLTAVAYHSLIKKEPLIKGMISGDKTINTPLNTLPKTNYLLMCVIGGISATGVYWLVNLA
ncbi:cytochrome b/b6 domain-containing protein [Neptunomonas sp.]|uniref:cytochrome b/b6 domain-containing protein n=1 Tax=Neptunomonas sp. TaxID=1971898 RepID=UPI0025F478F1|nr:cytochrome b/b6 domain-containing protein [Neptunomonas sp.]